MATSRITAPVSLYSPTFQVILSRLDNCKDVLCLGRNPNCSSRFSPRSLNLYKILVSRILSNNLLALSKRLMGQLDEGCAGCSWIQLGTWLFYTVLLLFCLVGYWSVGRFVGLEPRAALLEQISKSDPMTRPRLSSLPLVQFIVWLSEGSGVMSRVETGMSGAVMQKGHCLVRYQEQKTGEWMREGCCEVKFLLIMWGVPTG